VPASAKQVVFKLHFFFIFERYDHRSKIKDSMTGLIGNSEFCLPSAGDVPQDEAEGKQTSLFSLEPVISVY